MTKQQKMVYRLLTYCKRVPVTAKELSHEYSTDMSVISKRLPELEKAGLVVKLPKKRKCKIAKHLSFQWVIV